MKSWGLAAGVGLCFLGLAGCAPHAGPMLPEGQESTLPDNSMGTTAPPAPASASVRPLMPTAAVPGASPVPVSRPRVKSTPDDSMTPFDSPQYPRSAPTLPAVRPTASTDSDPVTAPNSTATSAGAESGSTFDNVEVINNDLKGKLAVLRVGSEPTANNLLSVFMGLKNRTVTPLDLEIQTIYKDKDGATLNHGGWLPMTLKPREETEYHSASISSAAADFYVRIRRPLGGPTGL